MPPALDIYGRCGVAASVASTLERAHCSGSLVFGGCLPDTRPAPFRDIDENCPWTSRTPRCRRALAAVEGQYRLAPSFALAELPGATSVEAIEELLPWNVTGEEIRHRYAASPKPTGSVKNCESLRRVTPSARPSVKVYATAPSSSSAPIPP